MRVRCVEGMGEVWLNTPVPDGHPWLREAQRWAEGFCRRAVFVPAQVCSVEWPGGQPLVGLEGDLGDVVMATENYITLHFHALPNPRRYPRTMRRLMEDMGWMALSVVRAQGDNEVAVWQDVQVAVVRCGSERPTSLPTSVVVPWAVREEVDKSVLVEVVVSLVMPTFPQEAWVLE